MNSIATAGSARWLTWRSAVDVAVPLAIVLFGYFVATDSVTRFVHQGGTPSFYQPEFGPAVSLACGDGFRNLRSPELDSYLTLKTDHISCSTLAAAAPGPPLNPFQRISRYLLYAAAAVWALAGVSWAALLPLHGILGASTAWAIYALCRLVMPRALAALLCCIILISPLHVEHLPHLRDYAKAPFLLGLILIMGTLVRRTSGPRRLLALAAVSGIVFGVGLGFRNDLLIAVIPLLLAILCAPVAYSRAVLLRIACSGLFVIVTVVVAFPVLRDYRQGNNTAHVALLGLTSPFSHQLGLRLPLYNVGHLYLDEYMYTTVRAVGEDTEGFSGLLPIGSPEYDRVSTEYLRQIVTTFPADVVIRSYAAAIRVLAAPFRPPFIAPTPWASGWLAVVQSWRASVVATIGLTAVWIVGLMLLGLLLVRPKAGVVAVAVLVFFGGGAAVQFQYRHIFHLEVLPWFAMGAGFVTGTRVVRRLRKGEASGLASELPTACGWVLATLLVFAVPGALWGARQYQTAQVRALFDSYLNALRAPLRTARVDTDGGTMVTIELPREVSSVSPAHPIRRAFIVAEFSRARCDYFNVRPVVRYGPAGSSFDLSREFVVPIPSSGRVRTRLFFPVYAAIEKAGPVLQGLEFRGSQADCLGDVQRVRTGSDQLLVDVVLRPEWQQATLYQTLPFESASSGRDSTQQFVSSPEGLDVRRTRVAQVGLLRPDEVELRGGAFVQYGDAPLPLSDTRSDDVAVISRLRAVPKGTYAVAAGQLFRGAIRIELRDTNGRTVRGVAVEHTGEFTSVLVVPEDAQYRLAIASTTGNRVRLKVRRFGWADPR